MRLDHLKGFSYGRRINVLAKEVYDKLSEANDLRHRLIYSGIQFKRRMRREEKQKEKRRRMALFRAGARQVGIALYWQEKTQQRLCAPGGAGRKRDFEAFQADGF